MQPTKAAALVFLKRAELAPQQDVAKALADLDAELAWRAEGERGPALMVRMDGQAIAVALDGRPISSEAYADHLEAAGLDAPEKEAILSHGSTARCVSMDDGEPVEPADRMSAVYKVASRLAAMDGIAILAPTSGVFVLGLEPGYVDERLEEGVPPLDLWVQVEMVDRNTARTAGASVLGVPEVVLQGVDDLAEDAIYCTVLDVVAYLERIRRELVKGETVHVGGQRWHWVVLEGASDRVLLRRSDRPQS